MNRRQFITTAGAVGLGGGLLARSDRVGAVDVPTGDPGHGDGHGRTGVVGTVDHERNGFDPSAMLTDFDGGVVSRGRHGGTVREYELAVVARDIEVAPGVFFPAWAYNGRVPGPTIRCTEGDRLRITLVNGTEHPHTIHFHGIHSAEMDGVPGAGETAPGESFTYDFVAEPFGTHLYHCHSSPLREHIHRGLYGAYIVDPPGGRPPAHEMVMVMNGFDTDFDGENEVYAANTVAFAYVEEPVVIRAGELQRLHVINVTEFDPLNSIHLHATFFDLYRTGMSLVPHERTDTISMGQAERHMIEFTYRQPGRYMFHAHQTEFTTLGWMGEFDVQQ